MCKPLNWCKMLRCPQKVRLLLARGSDKIMPVVKEWQERPLEEVYSVVFMDAIHYHVRSEGRIVKRAVYHELA